ncbi:MAG: hypothetical protein GY841_10355 [FCB group bacterium]|nr:hypothetical protein [FCB group bacterium]
MRVEMPHLHPAQETVRATAARFKVLACGRRWGKTLLGTALCLETAAKKGRAWWVAPSYKMGAVGWRGVRMLAQQIPGARIGKVDRIAELPGGGSVQVRSADDPQSLRGDGLDFAVLDECAFMREEAWTEALRPALSDRRGGALFISTPKGHNWFWRLWERTRDGDDWHGWQFPTSANPFIDAAEIEAARGVLPERVYEQEYLAQFLDDAGGVFRGVMSAATATPQDTPIDKHQYVIGVDWGKSNDFTVLTIVDLDTREVVYLDRFNQIDYVVQAGRLTALYELFQPTTMIVEKNSIGEPLIERLQRDGLPITPFNTTNASKAAAIDALALAFERKDIKIPNDPILIGELQAYEMQRLPSGTFRYNAPQGMHDDCVMSLALAWHGAERPRWLIH